MIEGSQTWYNWTKTNWNLSCTIFFYFYLAPVNWELHLHASRVFFAEAKIKLAKAKIKSAEDRSSELLKFKWKSHLKHYSIESTCKPQSLMSSIPSHICSHFSILNQNLTLNLRSLRSLYSQSQVSLVSSLKSQPFTDWHTVHNPNPGCCRCRLITTLTASPHCPPWVKASHADRSAY